VNELRKLQTKVTELAKKAGDAAKKAAVPALKEINAVIDKIKKLPAHPAPEGVNKLMEDIRKDTDFIEVEDTAKDFHPLSFRDLLCKALEAQKPASKVAPKR